MCDRVSIYSGCVHGRNRSHDSIEPISDFTKVHIDGEFPVRDDLSFDGIDRVVTSVLDWIIRDNLLIIYHASSFMSDEVCRLDGRSASCLFLESYISES